MFRQILKGARVVVSHGGAAFRRQWFPFTGKLYENTVPLEDNRTLKRVVNAWARRSQPVSALLLTR